MAFTSFEYEIAVLKDFSEKMAQLEVAENTLRIDNGQRRIRKADEPMELLVQSIKTGVDCTGELPSADRQALWEEKLKNSPALTVLRSVADRINDELLADNTDKQ
jgi:hypothetical protein